MRSNSTSRAPHASTITDQSLSSRHSVTQVVFKRISPDPLRQIPNSSRGPCFVKPLDTGTAVGGAGRDTGSAIRSGPCAHPCAGSDRRPGACYAGPCARSCWSLGTFLGSILAYAPRCVRWCAASGRSTSWQRTPARTCADRLRESRSVESRACSMSYLACTVESASDLRCF